MQKDLTIISGRTAPKVKPKMSIDQEVKDLMNDGYDRFRRHTTLRPGLSREPVIVKQEESIGSKLFNHSLLCSKPPPSPSASEEK